MPFFLLFIGICLGTMPAFAQAQKDSYYFMLDDGIQDEEEMIEEAEYVQGLCFQNSYANKIFDCECVAATFLQKREEMGGIMPQEEITQEIYRGGLGSCANSVQMAGDMYQDCQNYVRTFREYAPDNDEFCECAANDFAENFARQPFLRTSYIENLRVRAFVDCETRGPNGRPIRQD